MMSPPLAPPVIYNARIRSRLQSVIRPSQAICSMPIFRDYSSSYQFIADAHIVCRSPLMFYGDMPAAIC